MYNKPSRRISKKPSIRSGLKLSDPPLHQAIGSSDATKRQFHFSAMVWKYVTAEEYIYLSTQNLWAPTLDDRNAAMARFVACLKVNALSEHTRDRVFVNPLGECEVLMWV